MLSPFPYLVWLFSRHILFAPFADIIPFSMPFTWLVYHSLPLGRFSFAEILRFAQDDWLWCTCVQPRRMERTQPTRMHFSQSTNLHFISTFVQPRRMGRTQPTRMHFSMFVQTRKELGSNLNFQHFLNFFNFFINRIVLPACNLVGWKEPNLRGCTSF